MTEALPAPLVPPEVDLSDFQYMELDVQRLRDSKFAAEVEAEAFRAGVLLWCASWHQIPAGSLPDNEKELANLAGFGRVLKEWRKVREEALSLFVKCSDGRLYHKVIAEKAIQGWEAKLQHQYNRLCDRLRKENKKRKDQKVAELPIPSIDQWKADGRPMDFQILPPQLSAGRPPEIHKPSAGIPPENALKGNRTEQNGEGTERTIYSVPNGTGADAPILTHPEPIKPKPAKPKDPVKEEIWHEGKRLLVEVSGMTKEKAGEILGALIKDHGQNRVLEAIRHCIRESIADPKTYLLALQKAPAPSKQQSLEARNAEAAARWLAQEEAKNEPVR